MTTPREPSSGTDARAAGSIAPPPGFAHAYVRSEARCARCAYDLRSLPVEGRCPECGLHVWITLRHIVDPAASSLPRLRDPVGVGNALVWLVACAMIAAILVAGHAALLAAGVPGQTQVPLLPMMLLHDVLLVAVAVTLAGLWSVVRFHPSRPEERVGVKVDVWLVGVSLIAIALALAWLWRSESWWAIQFLGHPPPDVVAGRAVIHLLLALAALAGWIGLRGILRTIGRRSRAYRRAQFGRQNIRPMIAATLGIALGSAVRLLGATIFSGPPLEQPVIGVGTVIVWVSVLMVLIGLGYLVVNASWIRQALHHPPPRLEDLLSFPPGRTDGERR